MSFTRRDGRSVADLRPIEFETGLQAGADGSVLIKWGGTHVLCAASFEDKVPGHRVDSGGGWLTAEYNMLPACTRPRYRRERSKMKGRTAEIQRLIGRSLRASVDLQAMGPRTLWIDCDVVQADGGTRCASITGAWVACTMAMAKALPRVKRPAQIAAVSLGLVEGRVLTDLDYSEDSRAEVDLNYVAIEKGIVELQGTAEGKVFSRAQLDQILDAAEAARVELFEVQSAALRAAGVEA